MQGRIKRVVIKNYKSIESCDIRLDNLTLLVGANGAGKSNVVDAMCFVRDALRLSLDFAIRDRGGINNCRRRSGGHPTHFGLRLDVRLSDAEGFYAFEIGALPNGGFKVAREQCQLQTSNGKLHYFSLESGAISNCSIQPAPAASADRLFLINASGVSPFRQLYEFLNRMGFYNLTPKAIRDLQEPEEGHLLDKYGANLASVFARLQRQSPEIIARVESYLSKVVPSVHGVEFKAVGPRHTLEFRQDVAGQKNPWRFWAASMSDGTLRALGVLAAIFQSTEENVVPFVAIEEPEIALHPAAAGVLFDSLTEASRKTQLLVTTHSSDLLDRPNIEVDQMYAVSSIDGVTKVCPIDEAAKQSVKSALFTPGELLRLDQLAPDSRLFEKHSIQPNLFDNL
jgi:predicted ATPase